MEDERLRAIGKPALLDKSDYAEENKVNHVMRLAPSPFEMIEAGTKTIELRLFDEKRRNLHVGDVIEFIHTENSSKTLLGLAGIAVLSGGGALWYFKQKKGKKRPPVQEYDFDSDEEEETSKEDE